MSGRTLEITPWSMRTFGKGCRSVSRDEFSNRYDPWSLLYGNGMEGVQAWYGHT